MTNPTTNVNIKPGDAATGALLQSKEVENMAQTLARVLPDATVLLADESNARIGDLPTRAVIALPPGHRVHDVDLEALLPAPRHAVADVHLADATSFLAYVDRHHTAATVVWCDFNPQSYALSFRAVLDDFGASGEPGWARHAATFKPLMAVEWQVWTKNNGREAAKEQLPFAEFLERQEADIASVPGLPTSLQMMEMATNFAANSDKRVKSVVRLQGGGVRLDYVDDDNAETLDQMKVFEKFQIGIPVFWGGPGYRIDARLKYRHASGKVAFWYELIRPDRVHESAAKDTLQMVRDGLPAMVPMLIGSRSKG